MSINRIDLQGVTMRTGEYSAIKQNEDNKGAINQSGFQQQFAKEINEKSESVQDPENTQKENHKFDAKEKGSNSYEGDGGRQKKEDEPSEETKKNARLFGKDGKSFSYGGYSGFDLKV